MSIDTAEIENRESNQKKDAETRLHNPNKLIGLSGQAEIFAWVMLFFSVVFFICALLISYQNFNNPYTRLSDPFEIFILLLSFLPALLCLSLHLILRFIAQGTLLLLDMEIDLLKTEVANP